MTDELPLTYDLAELLTDGTPRYKEMTNGGIYDRVLFRIVKGASMTSEQGRELQSRRQELGQMAALQGMTEGLGLDARKAGSGEEWRQLVKLFTVQFKQSKNLRGMAEAFEKLGRATGYLLPANEMPVLQAVTSSLAKLFERLDRDVIDA